MFTTKGTCDYCQSNKQIIEFECQKLNKPHGKKCECILAVCQSCYKKIVTEKKYTNNLNELLEKKRFCIMCHTEIKTSERSLIYQHEHGYLCKNSCVQRYCGVDKWRV